MINGIIKLFYSEVVKTNMKKMPIGEYSLKDEYKEIKNLTLKIDSLMIKIIKFMVGDPHGYNQNSDWITR